MIDDLPLDLQTEYFWSFINEELFSKSHFAFAIIAIIDGFVDGFFLEIVIQSVFDTNSVRSTATKINV